MADQPAASPAVGGMTRRDLRTRREKLQEMAYRGTLHEQVFAIQWLRAHPLAELTGQQVLDVDDSAYGPTGAEVDAAIDEYLRRERRRTRSA